MTVQDITKRIVSGVAEKEIERALAFHCSGGTPSHYQFLAGILAPEFSIDAPENIDIDTSGRTYDKSEFSLADEASRTIRKMDAENCNAYHLVGHSYGGAVALHIALARPELIRSITLYEPCVFNLFKYAECRGQQALQEITTMMDCVINAIETDDYWTAMMTFVDYWNEDGTWAALTRVQQNQLMQWAPKVVMEFNAIMKEETPLESLHSLEVPTKVILGEFTPFPMQVGSSFLAIMLGNGHTHSISGAGHMGPLTHARQMATVTKNHINEIRIATLDDQTVLPVIPQDAYFEDSYADLMSVNQ